LSCFATRTSTSYITRVNSGVGGGHFSLDVTMRKIIHVNYWWPTMNINVHELCQTCDLCQRSNNLLTQNMAKLIITLPGKPFQKWELDSIGPIKPTNCYCGN
jgi:hypothetical protein